MGPRATRPPTLSNVCFHSSFSRVSTDITAAQSSVAPSPFAFWDLPTATVTMLSRAGSRRESGVIGIEDYEDAPTKRGYTTRHKEQQQQLRPTFTGRVRRWEKRWAKQGHLTVWRWERVEGDAADANTDASTGPDEPLRKRARLEQQARRSKLDDDGQQESRA